MMKRPLELPVKNVGPLSASPVFEGSRGGVSPFRLDTPPPPSAGEAHFFVDAEAEAQEVAY